jgi:hypothetical protein
MVQYKMSTGTGLSNRKPTHRPTGYDRVGGKVHVVQDIAGLIQQLPERIMA